MLNRGNNLTFIDDKRYSNFNPPPPPPAGGGGQNVAPPPPPPPPPAPYPYPFPVYGYGIPVSYGLPPLYDEEVIYIQKPEQKTAPTSPSTKGSKNNNLLLIAGAVVGTVILIKLLK